MRLRAFFLLGAWLIWARIAAGESPRIGLALSGGGAKGLAHVGVLKVLEEEGVPIDYITGTSMGSIIGALYAIGYSAADLEAFALSTNWNALFSENVARSDLALEYKRFDGRYMASLPIVKRRIKLPSGLIGDQNVFKLFARLTLPVHHVEDFTRLPIPFACVATDIGTGEAVVLKRGFLPEAMRASMSLPSIFAPIEIEGRLLVDGGVVRNFPVEDVRNLGADFVIGVDVGSPLFKPEELDSFVKILDQTLSFISATSTRQQRALCDVLLLPDMSGLSIADFSSAREIIARGEEAARRALPQIRALLDSVGRDDKQGARRFPAFPDSISVNRVVIEGLQEVDPTIVRKELRIEPLTRISVNELDRAVDRVYSTRFFDRVVYRVLPGAEGASIVVNVVEKKEDLFRFGLRYDSHLDASLLLGGFFRNVGNSRSFLNLDLRLGQRIEVDAYYFLHLRWLPRVGVSTRGRYTQSFVDRFDRGRQIGRLNIRSAYGEVFVGSTLATKLSVGLGARAEYSRVTQKSTALDTVVFAGWLVPFVGTLWVDTFDQAYFPSRGLRLLGKSEVTFKALGSDRHFARFFFDATGYLPLSRRFSLLAEILLAGKTGGALPAHYAFVLGGMDTPALFAEPDAATVSFVGLRAQELNGPFAQFFQLGLQMEVRPNVFLVFRANLGNTFESWKLDWSPGRFKQGLGFTLGANTPLGPIELTLMGGSENDVLTHFNLGFKF